MELLVGVIVLAVTWHVGAAVVEYHRRPERDRPPLRRLLLLAEVELIRALRAELKRRCSREGEHQRKLAQINERLRELEEHEAWADS